MSVNGGNRPKSVTSCLLIQYNKSQNWAPNGLGPVKQGQCDVSPKSAHTESHTEHLFMYIYIKKI